MAFANHRLSNQENRIEFLVHMEKRSPGKSDLYLNLDSALKRDMQYHYAGMISALYWIELCQDPKYGHVGLVDLIDRIAPRIIDRMCADTSGLSSLSFVSLGPGDGEVDIRILRHLQESLAIRCYHGFDFSFELLRYAVGRISVAKGLRGRFPIRAIYSDFAEAWKYLPLEEGIRLFSLTGFTLGNYNEAHLIGQITKLMNGCDFLLVDARLHDFESWNGRSAVPKQQLLHLLSSYSDQLTNRFVFGPIEAATRASSADVTFDCRISREITCVPMALNATIFCKGLRTKMRLTGELITRERLDLASTTFYRYSELRNWLSEMGLECIWTTQEHNVALFLLKQTSSPTKKALVEK
jgi:hypothetical protein